MSHDLPDDELEQLLRAYYAKKRAPAPDLEQVIAALDAALGAESGRLNHRYTATPPLSDETLPRHFNREDADQGEDYAFTLEDTLEETMATDHDPHTSHPATTARSSRWNAPQRMLSPRVTAIAGIAACADHRDHRCDDLHPIRCTSSSYSRCDADTQRVDQSSLAKRQHGQYLCRDHHVRRELLVWQVDVTCCGDRSRYSRRDYDGISHSH